MTDEVTQEAVPEVAPAAPTNENQVYLESVLARFNANPEDPSLSVAERVLMSKIAASQKEISEKVQKVNELNQEAQQLTQAVVHLQGQSQGFLDSLLALKPTSEG
jgi:predicted transcriptional regulator